MGPRCSLVDDRLFNTNARKWFRAEDGKTQSLWDRVPADRRLESSLGGFALMRLCAEQLSWISSFSRAVEPRKECHKRPREQQEQEEMAHQTRTRQAQENQGHP